MPKAALDDTAKAILSTMSGEAGPWSNKQVAEAAGLDAKKVGSVMSGLKKKGLVDSPVRCKYSITDLGKKEVS